MTRNEFIANVCIHLLDVQSMINPIDTALILADALEARDVAPWEIPLCSRCNQGDPSTG